MSSSADLDHSFDDSGLIALLGNLVCIPSVSRAEDEIARFVFDRLADWKTNPRRFENNVYAVIGPERAPVLCLNTHLDTVPASGQWKFDPYAATRDAGRIYGLGSNDAKASLASMMFAFKRLALISDRLPVRVMVAFTAQEEVGGKGAELLLPHLAEQGLTPSAAIVGEPTALDIATAQKGLCILKLIAEGTSCHAAHAKTLKATNAIRVLADALNRIDHAVESGLLGEVHPTLGEITVEPTVLSGGTARNLNPSNAECFFDIRTHSRLSTEELHKRLSSVLKLGRLEIFSDRLKSYELDDSHRVASAALRASQKIKPTAKIFGSRTLSDLVFFNGIPAVKAGPGVSERSHTADEYVLESELIDGAKFYENWVKEMGHG